MQETQVSTRTLTRILIILIAGWTFLEGVVLVGFHSSGSSALSAGISDKAGQRLVGVHMLVLAPAYLLVALRPSLYRTLIWLPFAGQLAYVLAVGYSILVGDTDFGDGIAGVAVGSIFLGMLAWVWINEQRDTARRQFEEREEALREEADSPFREP